MVAFDWSKIEAINYTFRVESTSKYARLQQHFKEHHSDELSGDELADIFTTEDGIRTLIPDAITFLRVRIGQAFVDDLNIGNDEERENMQNHIAVLMAETSFKCIRNDGTQVMVRDVNKLTRLAAQISSQGADTLRLELSIHKWHFRRNWSPGEFLKIYLEGHEEPSDSENDDEESSKTESTATRNPSRSEAIDERLAQILEEQKEMIGDIARLAARNNATDQDPQATRRSPPDLTWNTNVLPTDVRERHDMCEQYLTSEQMKPFKIENTDENGNVTSTIDANYYLHFDNGLQKLITRDGDCFDFEPIQDQKALEKLFMAEFPKLQSDTGAHVRKWYREIISHAQPHHVYIHPYFNFRRDSNHNRGFTIGDDFPHDVPKRYEANIKNWGSGNLISNWGMRKSR
jgi:hypothetical protein